MAKEKNNIENNEKIVREYDGYVIIEQEFIEKHYVLRKIGEKYNIESSSRLDALEQEIKIREAYKTVSHLPFYNGYVYLKDEREYDLYADYLSVLFAGKHMFSNGKYENNRYFIIHKEEIFHGADWYKFESYTDDGEYYNRVKSLKDIKDEYEKRISGFDEALQNPKTRMEAYGYGKN